MNKIRFNTHNTNIYTVDRYVSNNLQLTIVVVVVSVWFIWHWRSLNKAI